MGLLNSIKDSFTSAEFTVAPQKKLKTLSADFLKTFGLQLVFYKGVQIADGNLTLNQLNSKVSQNIKTTADGLKIKASSKVGDVEKAFKTQFGVTVQVKDKDGKICVPNGISLGKASRGEY